MPTVPWQECPDIVCSPSVAMALPPMEPGPNGPETHPNKEIRLKLGKGYCIATCILSYKMVMNGHSPGKW